MSITALPARSNARRLQSADDLVEVLGIPFSDQQLAAITAPLEPGVIIAGAGSGKTTVMAARVVWLVGTGAVRPEQVLGLTFTRKAAAELSGRVRTALLTAGVIDERGVDDAGEQVIMTYDAFAARLVAEHGLRIGVDSDATMITGATRFRLASRVVRSAAGPFEHISRLRPDTVTERVLKLDADLQQHLIEVSALDAHARDNRTGFASAPPNQRGNVFAEVKRALLATDERLELASLVRDYQALKSRLGVVEFADEMAIAARLAVEVPEVSDQLRADFAVVLLDEYQDTSAAQAIMLRGLFSGHAPLTGRGHPVTAVGDPFQAIYGWRGAAASNILQFADHFRRRDDRPAAQFALTVNRRSGQTVLDVANRLAAPLRHDVTERLAALLSGSRSPGAAPHLDLDPLRAPEGTRPGQVRAATFDTWEQEAGWIGDQVVAQRAAREVARWSDIAVLTRRNADIGAVYGELTSRDVPVEIVGLGGLLSLPEVADVVATLRVIDDVTANPELVRLLTGPRWRIGPADLALLGRRARALADQDRGIDRESRAEPRGVGSALSTTPRAPRTADILAALQDAVADVDPTEVVSLLDALENPVEEAVGHPVEESGFSAAALERFAEFAAELGYLRRHGDEPLLDLCRRVVAVLGLDVELSATVEYARSSRRDQLGAFLDAVAGYVDVDGQASLSGLLAYLRAELEQGTGLDQALPTAADSVKLLTVHKAKGLEWEVVYLPALMQGTFPSDRVSDNWVTGASVLPADLRGDAGSIPQLGDHTGSAIKDYAQALKEQQLLAEDRLAYVAVTRARTVLVGTGHTWRPDAVRPRLPSGYLKAIVAEASRQGRLLAEAGPVADQNPLETQVEPVAWPAPLDPDAWQRRRDAADRVRSARARFHRAGRYDGPDPDQSLDQPLDRSRDQPLFDQLMLDQEEVVASWDADIDHLLEEARAARRGRRVVELPDTMSATSLLRIRADPGRYAAELARPMPHRPSAAARFGTRFHQWVEHHLGTPDVQPSLIDPDDSADRPELDAASEDEFTDLCDRFAAGPFGSARPHGLEAPFSILIGGRVVRGRIDAIYRAGPDGSLPGDRQLSEAGASRPGRYRYRIVDWKTSPRDVADPWQLALYRLAWAELSAVAPDEVDAVFYFVGSDAVVRPSRLAGRDEIVQALLDVPQTSADAGAAGPLTGPTRRAGRNRG